MYNSSSEYTFWFILSFCIATLRKRWNKGRRNESRNCEIDYRPLPRVNVSSVTLAQHLVDIGWTYCVSWPYFYVQVETNFNFKSHYSPKDGRRHQTLYFTWECKALPSKQMLLLCWPSVFNAGPTLSQHWFNVLCFLGCCFEPSALGVLLSSCTSTT